MALTHSDSAAVALIVRNTMSEPLAEIRDRLSAMSKRTEHHATIAAEIRTILTEGFQDMKSQTLALIASVAALQLAFTNYSAQVDAKLAAAQAAHEDDDDEGFAKAMSDLSGLKDTITGKLGDLVPKVDAVNVLTPHMPESPDLDPPKPVDVLAKANPPSADPNAAPFNPSEVQGDSLKAQAVASASSDGKPVDGHTLDNNPGDAAAPIGSPVALPVGDAVVVEPATGTGSTATDTAATLSGVDVTPRPVTEADPLKPEPIAPVAPVTSASDAPKTESEGTNAAT